MAKRGLMAIGAISVLVMACPTAYAASSMKGESKKMDCRFAEKQCAKEAKNCLYKFTVKEVVDQQTLIVTYPPSVWSVTMEDMKDQEEEDYEKCHKDKEYTIHLKSNSSAATAPKTYFFTKSSDNEFTLGSEDDPNETHDPK